MSSPAGYNPSLEYEEEQSKLARKAKDSPFMPIGLAGLATALFYGAYKYRNRGTMSTSLYLMQLRVASQGMVVVALTGGVAYTLFTNYVMPKLKEKEN